MKQQQNGLKPIKPSAYGGREDTLKQVNPFAESHKEMQKRYIKYVNMNIK
jgi:hypothetical protein